MLDKETKRSRRTNSQTKIHRDSYNIMKPGLYLWKKKKGEEGRVQKLRRRRQSTHVEVIIRGQERHWQQSRQTFICLAAGEETASFTVAARQDVWEKKEAIGSGVITQGDFVFAAVSRLFAVIIFADRKDCGRDGDREKDPEMKMRHLSLCAEKKKAEVSIQGRPWIRLLRFRLRARVLRTWAKKRKCLRVCLRVRTLPVCVCVIRL